MEYLQQIELFVIKKLLLETGGKLKEYHLTDFNEHGVKIITDRLLQLARENSLTLSSIKIGPDFFKSIFSSSDFIDVDFDERGRPTHAGINYKAIRDRDYMGLGEKVFKRYEEECCPESDILGPDFDLEVNAEELKYIIKNSSHFSESYGDALFKNLTFSICQSKKQKEGLEKYLGEYLEKFRNDNLERQSATDYYRYARQKEMLHSAIEHFRKDYPIKNLWLKESNVNLYGNQEAATIRDSAKRLNFLETLLCLEQESNKDIKIEELDPQKGVKITDYSANQTPNSEKPQGRQKDNAAAIPIKNARLDEQNYLLEINNGEKIISFKSKKRGEGLERETKQFKILYQLWEFRWEFKNGKVVREGDYASLENLARGGASESTEAAYKHIQRLNTRFRKEGIAIEIKGENEKYRLIINKE